MRRATGIAVEVSWWLAVLASGCVAGPAQEQVLQSVEITGGPPESDAPLEDASILSAHFAVDDGVPQGRGDALPVVFSVEIDAATVVAEYFVVAREDGSRARPEHALLSPANESDENRTVLLLGDFGAPGDRPATNVAVIGPLYAENGQTLRGLATTVLAFDSPPTVVYAERLAPAPGRCADAKLVVRTYWTEGLRGLAADAVAHVTLETSDGDSVQPAAFDDQGAPGSDGADDNVLDLCMAQMSAVRRLRIDAGVVTDPAGHANEAIDMDVAGTRG